MRFLFFKDPIFLQQVVFFPMTSQGQVVMGMKKIRLGKGYRNGYGGNVKPNETKTAAVMREFSEESLRAKIVTESLVKNAIITIRKQGFFGGGHIVILHAYTGRYEGEIIDSDEMTDAKPFDIGRLPKPLMPGDDLWLFMALSGKRFMASLDFDPFLKRVPLRFKHVPMDSLPLD